MSISIILDQNIKISKPKSILLVTCNFDALVGNIEELVRFEKHLNGEKFNYVKEVLQNYGHLESVTIQLCSKYALVDVKDFDFVQLI